MVLLQLCHSKFSLKETLSQTLFDWTWILLKKMTNSLFEPPFWGVTVNIHTSSTARWKGGGWRPIHDNWTFFTSSYSWDFVNRYWSKLAFFKGELVTLSAISRRRWHRPPTSVGIRKLEWLPFHVVSKYRHYILSFRHKASVWQTDGRITITKTTLA